MIAPHSDYWYFIFNVDFPIQDSWWNVIQETNYDTVSYSDYPDTDNNDAFYYIVKALKINVPEMLLEIEPFKSDKLEYTEIVAVLNWIGHLWEPLEKPAA